MRDLVVLFLHLIVSIVRLICPGGADTGLNPTPALHGLPSSVTPRTRCGAWICFDVSRQPCVRTGF